MIISYDSIFILDQAQIGNDWRVKAHSCLFEALLRLLQVSHDVLLCDKWTAETIITLSHSILVLAQEQLPELGQGAIRQVDESHLQLLRLHDTT